MPFSVPPRLSGAPNSLIRAPLTGNGNCPRADGKSDRRRQPAGVVEGRQIDPVLSLALSSAARSADRAAPAGAVEALLDLSDQIFEIVHLAGQHERLLPLGLQRLFGLGLLFLPLARSAGRFAGVPRSARRRRGPGGPSRRRSPCGCARRSARSAASASACTPHLRHHRAEHDGGAHRLQRVLGPHHDRGRRMAADALQRGQHLGDGGAAAVERLAQPRSLSSSGLSRPSVSAIRSSASRSRAAASISAWLSLRRSSPMASISLLSLACVSAAFFCSARIASSSWSRWRSASSADWAGSGRRRG